MEQDGLTIRQLSEEVGISPRTINWYVRIGLLPPPVGATRNARYTSTHLAMLRAIRQARERNVTLDDLKDRFRD